MPDLIFPKCGHPKTPDNISIEIKAERGGRAYQKCKTCKAARQSEWAKNNRTRTRARNTALRRDLRNARNGSTGNSQAHLIPGVKADWSDRALCRGAAGPGDDPWYPDKDNPGESLFDEARALCGACPVRDLCLQHALDVVEEFGMWGGKTPRERMAILGKGVGE